MIEPSNRFRGEVGPQSGHWLTARVIVASVLTAALLVVCARGLGAAGRMRGRHWLELGALALPIVVSPYVFTSGVWLLPDNAGWALALIVVLNCVRSRQTPGTLMFSG